jgi:diaminohydroxyphosphoribosylaminopyrimidine deaminase/5-amino-6-(5-phosphoribosylamino)uracil reductase
MRKALSLAEQALFVTSPNPRVGCVITDRQGNVIGQGHTQRAGGPHAEIMALRDAAAQGLDVRGATAWVTLEPCSHHGRTGPCCDALIAAGIGKVVASLEDPNPRVAGQGFARLRAAGVEVQVGPGAAESRELNLGFLSRMTRARPWVRLKIAASLDGRTALPNGASQWITGPEARADGHAWRARACAILTGIGTVLADNPRLDVREVETPRQPRLAIVDSHLRTPPDAALFAPKRDTAPGRPAEPLLIYNLSNDAVRSKALKEKGATVIQGLEENGQIDLKALLQDLARREVNELHVEAGATLNGALLQQGLVDELLIYLAPKLLGDGRGMADITSESGPFKALNETLGFKFHEVRQTGADLRILARLQEIRF